MNIYISEEAVVADIQERFHSLYPQLKLQFYKKPYNCGEVIPAEDIISPGTPIEKIRMIHSFGWLDVSYYRTVVAVENDFSHLFGLNVRILQLGNTSWQDTTDKGACTLDELNLMAEAQ
ncbi:MAG: hypothetical protein JO154_23500 [Chitinophaga sp.]|uniref:hypothetical protein n=1 Tax=Chitinophaga sp. TaxID=1869181 RepID=UPI0025BB1BF8|nr:hypothetical protein [Chitinophaga sp.]MBV8255580.1 hypothetical protein [Chitinophaga sp.]